MERANQAISFLNKLWTYTSLDAKCFSVVTISNAGVDFRHFCVDEEKTYERLYISIVKYISENIERWTSQGRHVYYQVLPLSRKPERGRGTGKDVKVGRWVFADLDFKEVVDSPRFEGCREGQDHSLECYYREGDKWVYVRRPPLEEVLSDVEKKLGAKPTIVVDSGAGYHLYFKLKYEVEASQLKKLLECVVDTLGGDPQSKDLARILRLPGTVNPRVQRNCSVLREFDVELEPEELAKKCRTLHGPDVTRRAQRRGLRELSDSDIMKVVELLKEAYKPGYRQSLILFLSGWLAKAGVSPISAVKIVKHLYEMTQDQDPLKSRLSAVVYSYKKAGVDVDRYGEEIELLTEVRPYGLEREISEEEVKGRSGLQEILEDVIGEEKALAVVHEISEVLQTLSPWRDSVIELMDYEKQLYAVANLRKLVMVRATMREGGLRYKERIAVVAPTKVVVYDNPLGGIRKYEVVFEGSTLSKPMVVGPTFLEEIAESVRAAGYSYNSRLLYDVLSAIVQGFIRKGKADVKVEIESPGFYMVDGKIVTVKYEVKDIDKEKLRQALLLMNELAEVWFKHVADKFATVIKWGAVAPFNFIMKQYGRGMRWLYLYGDSATGKTTLGRIVLKMWGLDSRYEKTGASIDTPARFGHVVSMSTFPVLVNEPGGALMKEDIVEMIKNSVDSMVARGKYVRGMYTEYPALTTFIFTSNKFLPKDDALLRRLFVIVFSFGEKIPFEKQKEFKQRAESRLEILSEIGKYIGKWVVNESLNGEDPLEVGFSFLRKCYEYVGLEVPEWLKLEYEPDTVEFDHESEFVERFKKLVNDLFARYVSKVVEVEKNEDLEYMSSLKPDQVEISRKLELMLEKNMVPGVSLKSGGVVIIKRQLLEELGMEDISLKSLAERFGWDYRKISERVNKQVINYKGVVMTFEQLKTLFTGEVE